MGKLVEAKVVHKFKASPEQVFDAWLEESLVITWMSATLKSLNLSGDIRRVEIDAQVGGTFTFSDMRESGEAVHWGTYREIDRPHKLVFTWFTSAEDEQEDLSVVTLTIVPDGSGSIATIVHSFDARYAEYIPQTEKGWGGMLAQIDLLK